MLSERERKADRARSKTTVNLNTAFPRRQQLSKHGDTKKQKEKNAIKTDRKYITKVSGWG